VGHPDNIPDGLHEDLTLYNPRPQPENTYQADIAGGARINQTTCLTVWDRTFAGIPPNLTAGTPGVELGAGGYLIRDSVMEAFTQHNPKPCLTDDDVEALSTLYPDCSVISHSTNVCLTTFHNIGFVRIMIYFFCPMLIALVLVAAFSGWVHHYSKRELRTTRTQLSFVRSEGDKAKASKASAENTIRRLHHFISEAALTLGSSRSNDNMCDRSRRTPMSRQGSSGDLGAEGLFARACSTLRSFRRGMKHARRSPLPVGLPPTHSQVTMSARALPSAHGARQLTGSPGAAPETLLHIISPQADVEGSARNTSGRSSDHVDASAGSQGGGLGFAEWQRGNAPHAVERSPGTCADQEQADVDILTSRLSAASI